MRSVLASDQDLLSEDCQCRKSLELAVWTDPKAIGADVKESLQPLFE